MAVSTDPVDLDAAGPRPVATPRAAPRARRPRAWSYALSRTIHTLLVERVVDMAAALAFYSVLSVFPALLAIFGLLGMLGQGRNAADAALSFAQRIVPQSTISSIRGVVEHFANAGGGASVGTVLALLAALWAASRYVASFTGVLNRLYGVQEGRRLWKRRLVQLAITLAVVVLVAVLLFVLVVSRQLFGHRTSALPPPLSVVWNLAYWPIVAASALVIVVLLYWGTPNVRHPRLRWATAGGITALVLMAGASVGFSFYVTHFPTFHREYGSLAGLAIFCAWLWLMNLILLFGAGYDAELERVRELKAGTDATRAIRLPLRDERRVETLRRREDRLAAEGAMLMPSARS